MDNVLVLIRHGQSEWNKLNLFTGWKDVALTRQGIEEARQAGQALAAEGIRFDIAYTSKLVRAQETLRLMLEQMGRQDLETVENEALNERSYGDLTGLNKDDARKKWGDEQVHIWRRSFDIPPPGGESLKDTAQRVLPYFRSTILKDVLAGKNVVVSAHGNSLRALIMELENISPDKITQLELGTGVPMIYRLNEDGSLKSRRDIAA